MSATVHFDFTNADDEMDPCQMEGVSDNIECSAELSRVLSFITSQLYAGHSFTVTVDES